ncbi:MAG: hypothetical protein EAY66_09690 [Sphingobacteriales bacterium]|nr:MAG: hypothetical protein EAY66_09690 [Sphingobacteriales bacterium]
MLLYPANFINTLHYKYIYKLYFLLKFSNILVSNKVKFGFFMDMLRVNTELNIVKHTAQGKK